MDNIKIATEIILFVIGFFFVSLSYHFKNFFLIIPGIILFILVIFIYFNQEEKIEEIKEVK